MARQQLPLLPDTKYYVTSWDNGQVLSIHDTLSAAKKACRQLGSIPDAFRPSDIMPVAFVAADFIDDYEGTKNVVRCCIYNPRFK